MHKAVGKHELEPTLCPTRVMRNLPDKSDEKPAPVAGRAASVLPNPSTQSDDDQASPGAEKDKAAAKEREPD